MIRVKLSKYWWGNFYLFAVFGVCIVVATIWFQLRYVIATGSIPWWMLPAIAGLMLLGCVDAALKPWRFLMTMEVHEDVYRAFLFGKLKCEVSAKQRIYYSIFDCRESLYTTRKYIVISNTVFECNKRKPSFFSENRFIDSYDRTCQIIFPYNEMTQHLFAIESWILVNDSAGS